MYARECPIGPTFRSEEAMNRLLDSLKRLSADRLDRAARLHYEHYRQ